MNERQFQFEWDEIKAAANLRKHGVSFELASTAFTGDPRLLTVPDLEHSETEERWFSICWATNGAMLSIAYVWEESEPIDDENSAYLGPATRFKTEIRHYEESL